MALLERNLKIPLFWRIFLSPFLITILLLSGILDWLLSFIGMLIQVGGMVGDWYKGKATEEVPDPKE